MPANRSLPRDARGVAIVEFALVLPLLVLLLFGMLGYGQYFLLAHDVQQLANDAARSTVAGMTAAERGTLATATIARELRALPNVKPGTVSSAIEESADLVTVRVRLDASAVPLMRMTLVPMPDAVIERHAVVRPGGIV